LFAIRIIYSILTFAPAFFVPAEFGLRRLGLAKSPKPLAHARGSGRLQKPAASSGGFVIFFGHRDVRTARSIDVEPLLAAPAVARNPPQSKDHEVVDDSPGLGGNDIPPVTARAPDLARFDFNFLRDRQIGV
jgi:hypothetical protein